MVRSTQTLILMAVSAAFAQPTSWTTVRDTQEGAFSVDVPRGWSAHGGLSRRGPLDPRVQVDMASPDGRVEMRLGDWGVPPFTVPGGMMERLGFTEGKVYAPGNPPTATIVARYRTGLDFASFYARVRFAKVCQTFEPKSQKSMDPVFSPVQEGPITTTAGEAVYRCVQNGQEKMAYTYAESGLYQANGVANWHVNCLLSFLAPKEQANAAYKMIFQSAASFSENPQWHLRQLQITADNAASTLRTYRVQMQQQQARFERWSSSMARQGQTFSDILNGQTLTRDPATGQQREVWTGTGSTRWVDGLGNVVSSNMSPGTSFHALQDISR